MKWTQAAIDHLAGDYQRALAEWGEHNLVTVRAEIAYRDAYKAYLKQKERARANRRARVDAYESVGMVRVHSASGRTYWE